MPHHAPIVWDVVFAVGDLLFWLLTSEDARPVLLGITLVVLILTSRGRASGSEAFAGRPYSALLDKFVFDQGTLAVYFVPRLLRPLFAPL